MTLFEKRKAMHELREARKAAGKCQECGERPITRNMNGSKSVRCIFCKDRLSLSTKTAKRPTTDNWGVDEDHGFKDTQRFREYAVSVAKVIKRGATSIREQRLALGENFIERMHMDALDALLGAGEITERQSGSLTRYEPFGTRRTVTPTPYNQTLPMLPPTGERFPTALLD